VTDHKDVSHQTQGDGVTRAVVDFGESFAYNLTQKPVNAIVQEVNETAHCHLLPDLKFFSPPPAAAKDSLAEKAQKAGEIMAVVPWVVLGSKALSRFECLSDTGMAVPTARAAISGSAYGAFLQPVQDSKSGFVAGKFKNALEIGAGSAAFVGLQRGVAGDSMLSGGRQLLAGQVAAFGAGFVTENTRSLLDNGKPLTATENLQAVAPYAVLGAAAVARNFTLTKTARVELPQYQEQEGMQWEIPHSQLSRVLNAERRADDIAAGVVPTVKDSKLFDELTDSEKWKTFINRDDKQLYIDKSKGTIAKVLSADELTDQAAALKRIEGQYGVTVPQNVVLHTAGDKAALTMSYVKHETGMDLYVRAHDPARFSLRNRQADYMDLYKQGETLANDIHNDLSEARFFPDMHDENWGFTEKTIRNWRAGMTLNPKDLIVTDPVTKWTKPLQTRDLLTQ
jgi:hypothetical protein